MEDNYNILCICSNKDIRNTVTQSVTSTNLHLFYANNLQETLIHISSENPQIFFCDFNFAKQYHTEVFSLARKNNPNILINILLDQNDKDTLFQAMSFGINNYLVFPIITEDLCNYLKLCGLIIQTRNKKAQAPQPQTSTTKTIIADNTIENVPEIVNSLVELCNQNFDKNEIRIGLEELIINAIEHGNLNISFAEKNQAIFNGTFEELVQERKSNNLYKDKKITISFHQEPNYDEWQIEDEGNGFDPSEIPTFTKLSQIQQLHGRGILISRFQFDEIEYKNEGRLVRIRRYASK